MPDNQKLKFVTCNLCGKSETQLLFGSTLHGSEASITDYVGTNPGYGKFHDIVKCKACSLIYMNPRDQGIPELLKAVEDTDYLATWEDRLHTFKSHLDLLKKIKPSGRLLDLGCYAGIFLSAAQDAGYQVEGIEPSKWAAEYASNRLHVPVTCQPIEAMELKENSYDIVTIWDVIEHLEDPAGTLIKIEKALKPNGVALISTHDIESLFARTLGSRYPWLMRFHLYHFTPKTLQALASNAGLKTILTEYYRKVLPLPYFLNRLGLPFRFKFLERIKFSINTGDMFLIVVQKSDSVTF
jgi:SAM-dependent methyltransferase